MLPTDELELKKFFVPEFILGRGALELAGRYARNFSLRKVLLVTDAGVKQAGWADRVCTSLNEADISYEIFDRVSPNPRAGEVMAGAEAYHAAECQGIVAVGGGSPIDCAKGIGIVTSNRRHILAFEGVDRVQMPAPPLVCVPTTAGSSADVSQFAIITDEDERRKIAIISKTLVPDISLLDPLPLTSMDATLTVDTGMDALCHAVEAYVSNASSPITDLHALEAIRLIAAALPEAARAPDDLQARYLTMLGSLYAGLAFSNASLGAVHAMAHSLGGLLDLAHGRCNAVLLEHVAGYNYAAAPDRFDAITRLLGQQPEELSGNERQAAITRAVAGFRRSLGIDASLADLGVEPGDLPALAERALSDPCMATNPRRPNQKDIEEIYASAF
ncbi:iron-containing alcohol dehydrogenase [Methanoculleus sp. FWC-SCC1]|uniref:Iron-containing alcohol dehydrogenase n=1 Tax=Methanoculleus frigidifontis TaxID=2584085 RepID=A0ABT8M9B5_9EURY|nr:alcohol dehydrogenase-like regulatory protein ErcA [Methanoculleus sp. FWC-SCC1]MDN7024496.1 iron-containing alcohol dehydrogenase [Methanoculleus sp. FWC-SCC1]